MKKFMNAVLASVLLTACSNGTYTIKGTLEGAADSTMVTLNVIENNSLAAIDSVMAMDGKFTLKGKTEECKLAFLTFDVEGQLAGLQVFLENGKIEARYNTATGEQFTKGTVCNNAFQDFYDQTSVLNDKAMEIEDKLRITAASDGDCSGLLAEMNALQDEYMQIVRNSILANTDNMFGYQQLLESYDMFEPDELAGMIAQLSASFGDEPELAQLSQIAGVQMRTATGAQYTDFRTFKLSGKDFESMASLSDYVADSKVVLLDFWASWCSPCRKEIPYLKQAYEKFSGKGFQIVSVSVDDDTDAWLQAVAEEGMTWPQLWNGADDMENSAAMIYAVSAIPSTFLIDAEGTIIGRNLRGEELLSALEDYFK